MKQKTIRRLLLTLSFIGSFLCAHPLYAEQDTSTQISLEAQSALFGLFNINREFTEADPGFGITPSCDFEINDYLRLGPSIMALWVKSTSATQHRLIINTHLRARSTFALSQSIELEVLAEAGFTLWPTNDSENQLNAALEDMRLGWSLRAGVGLSHRLSEKLGYVVDLGYFASTSYGNDLSATVDGLLISFGPRLWL